MALKAGTIIELPGMPAIGGFPAVPSEIARIAKPRKGEGSPEGYHIVQFEDGGRLNVHETRFRVISNS